MKIKHFIIVVIFLSFLYSCTIKQEYHFNRDLSGTAKSTVDMTMLMGFMKGQMKDGEKKLSMKDSLNNAMGEIEEKFDIEGISNLKTGWNDEETAFFISYDFEDIEALNKVLHSSDFSSNFLKDFEDKEKKINTTIPKFESNGRRKLKFISGKIDVPEQDSTSNQLGMESMTEMYQYEIIFSFDRKIRKFDNPNATLSDDKKTLTLKGSLMDFFSPKYNSDVNFKLSFF